MTNYISYTDPKNHSKELHNLDFGDISFSIEENRCDGKYSYYIFPNIEKFQDIDHHDKRFVLLADVSISMDIDSILTLAELYIRGFFTAYYDAALTFEI